LSGIASGEHHVESRQPVGGHDEQRVLIDGVDVAHLALVDAGKASEFGAVHDGRRHALGTIAAFEPATPFGRDAKP